MFGAVFDIITRRHIERCSKNFGEIELFVVKHELFYLNVMMSNGVMEYSSKSEGYLWSIVRVMLFS